MWKIVHPEPFAYNSITGMKIQIAKNMPVQSIAEALWQTIISNDIEIWHRLTVANCRNENIVLQFVHWVKRNFLLQRARRFRYNCSDIGFGARISFYGNEHVCPELIKLLGETTAKEREAGWQFAWVRNVDIFARKTKASAAVPMTWEDDLRKIHWERWAACNSFPENIIWKWLNLPE